ALVVRDRVDAEPDDLAAALFELGLQPRHVTELGRAHRGEVLGMREEDGPPVPDPLVEVDLSLGGLGGEGWGFPVDPYCHVMPPCKHTVVESIPLPRPKRHQHTPGMPRAAMARAAVLTGVSRALDLVLGSPSGQITVSHRVA